MIGWVHPLSGPKEMWMAPFVRSSQGNVEMWIAPFVPRKCGWPRSSLDSRRTGKREPHAVPATSCSVVASANSGGFARRSTSHNRQKYTTCSLPVKRSLRSFLALEFRGHHA